jgi:hypothetical protein
METTAIYQPRGAKYGLHTKDVHAPISRSSGYYYGLCRNTRPQFQVDVLINLSLLRSIYRAASLVQMRWRYATLWRGCKKHDTAFGY